MTTLLETFKNNEDYFIYEQINEKGDKNAMNVVFFNDDKDIDEYYHFKFLIEICNDELISIKIFCNDILRIGIYHNSLIKSLFSRIEYYDDKNITNDEHQKILDSIKIYKLLYSKDIKYLEYSGFKGKQVFDCLNDLFNYLKVSGILFNCNIFCDNNYNYPTTMDDELNIMFKIEPYPTNDYGFMLSFKKYGKIEIKWQ